MKKSKLSLSTIKVQSFITEVNPQQLVGGAPATERCFIYNTIIPVNCISQNQQSICGLAC